MLVKYEGVSITIMNMTTDAKKRRGTLFLLKITTKGKQNGKRGKGDMVGVLSASIQLRPIVV